MKRAIIAALVLVGGCAHAPVQPKVVSCNRDPQYWAYGPDGKPSHEIRVCFLSDGRLAWRADPARPQEPQAMTQDEKKFIRRGQADARRVKDLADEGIRRAATRDAAGPVSLRDLAPMRPAPQQLPAK
jgi:hypothetical protein